MPSKSKSGSRDKKTNRVAWLFNPATMIALVAFLAIPLWNRFEPKIDPVVNRRIDSSRLKLTGQPPWISGNIVEAVIHENHLSDVRLGQPDCLERIAAALRVQPWIRSVVSIRKTAEAVLAEVLFREPVGLVEFHDNTLVPVDEEATVLEGGALVPGHAAKYWRISVREPRTEGLGTGLRWNDLRISDAVAIARAWGGRQHTIGLMRIVNSGFPTGDRLRLQPFELWTASGFVICWGSAPGHELQGEADAETRIRALLKFVQEKGPLEKCGLTSIDIRDGTVRPYEAKLAGENADFIMNLK
jgi:hypothetical protein